MADKTNIKNAPHGVELRKGKQYPWCTCALSKKQPFCDNGHRGKTDLHSLKFEVDEEKTYWLCGCKETKNPPYCDGTHKML